MKLTRFDPVKYLDTPEAIAGYLNEAIATGDKEFALDALRIVAAAIPVGLRRFENPWLDWQPMATFPRDGDSYVVCNSRALDSCEVVFWDDEASTAWVLGTSDGPHYHPETFTHWACIPTPQFK